MKSLAILSTSLGSLALLSFQEATVFMTISVDEPRPVAAALHELEHRHGLVVSYEDPTYVHEADISDVTQSVRQDLDQYPPGKAPKVLVPRAGKIELEYPVSSETGNPVDPERLIERLLSVNRRNGNPGDFRVTRTSTMFQVVPLAVKDRDGAVGDAGSVLDVIISFPARERTGLEVLQEICSALSEETGASVVVGMVPDNPLARYKTTEGVHEEMARDVLYRLVANIGGKISWQLFYDPGLEMHVLNLHAFPE